MPPYLVKNAKNGLVPPFFALMASRTKFPIASYAVLPFFTWYNTEHRHSGIGLMTPQAVHYGQANQLFTKRQHVLQLAYAAHPERFVKGQPQPPQLPTAVWINPPKKEDPTTNAAKNVFVDTANLQ